MVVSVAYWAAGCGVGGFTGLQEQLHPEVQGVLLRSSHLGRLGKLTVQDERLHNGCHVPERKHFQLFNLQQMNMEIRPEPIKCFLNPQGVLIYYSNQSNETKTMMMMMMMIKTP